MANMTQLKYVPNNGIPSDVDGMDSEMTLMKTIKENKTVTPSDNFSVESGGSVNPSMARNPENKLETPLDKKLLACTQ